MLGIRVRARLIEALVLGLACGFLAWYLYVKWLMWPWGTLRSQPW